MRFLLCLFLLIQSIPAKGMTSDEIVGSFEYMKAQYYPLIESLRSWESVKRGEIFKVYKGDPLLEERRAGDGHRTFRHKFFGITFGINRHDGDEVETPERLDVWKQLQVYVNVFKNGILGMDKPENYVKRHKVEGHALREKNFGEATLYYDSAIGSELFNAFDPTAFQSLYDAESQEFENYKNEGNVR